MDKLNLERYEPNQRMRQLIESSQSLDIDKTIPIARYLKSTRELLKSAASHQESGDLEKAFVLYMRHMSLVLERLPKHPEWNKADKNEISQAKNQCNIIFDLAEKLKVQLKEKFELEYKEMLAKESNTEHSSTKNASESQKTDTEPDNLDEIDKQFNFQKTDDVETKDDKILDLFDLEKLKETLKSSK